MRRLSTSGVAALVLIAVALVYWPVVHANFVWIDWTDFHDQTWLREGGSWKHYIFRDFNTWTNYFRPLMVGLFTLQVRLFNVAPGPMHVVSLGLHLINTLLVGLLAWRYADASMSLPRRTCLLGVSMLLYGFHPVLIEPVAWIGCQSELLVTMFTLLGLIANTGIKSVAARAATVAVLFFLAACTKESAVSLPLILIVIDWALLSRRDEKTMCSAIRSLVVRNWPIYVAMFLAGVSYLVFRHWALGVIVNPFPAGSSTVLGRLQEVCFLYLHYWKTLLWPMSGMSPIHPVDVARFGAISMASVLTDAAAIGIVLTGLWLALRHSSTLGCMLLAVTAALLPVLHIASVDFDASLYHERYAMTALAIVCAMLPRLRPSVPATGKLKQLSVPLLATALLFWLVLAVINIRVMLPLWSNNVNLWRWTLVEYPNSITAKNNLLSAYIDAKDHASADRLVNRLLAEHVQCTNCMLNAARLAVAEHDPTRAATALEVVRNSRELVADKQQFHSYLLITSQMLVLQGHFEDAVQILREVIKLDPLDPYPHLQLAMALALEGKIDQAREVGESGIALLPPDERGPQRKMLDDALASAIQPPR